MKKNFTHISLVFAATVILFASCNKDVIKKTKADATDYKALSSQVATEFYKTITGRYSNIDVSKGITSPFKTSAAHTGLTTYSIAPLCGSVIDSSYNYQESISSGNAPPQFDTVRTYSGNFHFVYTCDAGVVNGYTVHANAFFKEAFYTYLILDTLVQDYTVKALDQTYKLVSMDGSITANNRTIFIQGEYGKTVNSSYTLNGLKVKITGGVADVIEGTATFHIETVTQELIPPQYWPRANYYGTITYLGNHKAKLTFSTGQVYMIDLLTGVATAV